ncbi:interleukin-17 receptor A isoform X2 [Amblyraja radiata]|uniref:interleukin-17 receptor A isoform X2 n=1 Tax=Amblyraja radiata TaxID=386614 RepID=UPI001403B94D|nr:interleukin-17 receptor A isoform X2 [Amblyraja radiata]
MSGLLSVGQVGGDWLRVLLVVLSVRGAGAATDLGDCSQQGLNCTVLSGNCLDSSWFKHSSWTPSFPKDLLVTLIKRRNQNGFDMPALSISWKLATDASIIYSQGIEISVKTLSTGEEKCIQYRFNNPITSQMNSNKEKWAFSLERFEVYPNERYTVSTCSLPRANINQDNVCPSFPYHVPGCRNDLMKYTEVCKRRGSLWNPDITYIRSEMKMAIFFQAANHSSKYEIMLQSYNGENKCNSAVETIEEALEQRVNVTFSTVNWMASCTAYVIMIIPYFEGCHHDCERVVVHVPVPETTPVTPIISPLELAPAEKTHIYTGVGVMVLVIAIGCIFWVQKKSKANEMLKLPKKEPSCGVYREIPQMRKKVLIIYSLDHNLYQNVVLAFAQFLMTVCGTEVTLDCLQGNEAAQMGHINWLALHKKESDKIIILCSRGTRAKWEAMKCIERRQVLLKSEERSPMHDMFTPAMYLILPDFKQPASFGKYIVAYFDDLSSEDDVPDPFNVVVKYKLMKQFEEIHFRVQDLEKYEPGKTFHVAGIAVDDYHKHPSGEKLKNAVQKFKMLQMQQPDWFEKECIMSSEEAGMEEEASFDCSAMEPNILQYKPYGMPCTVNEICMAISSDETFVMCPVGFECSVQDMGLSQNVIEIDCNEARALNPVYTLEPLICTSIMDCHQNVLNCSNVETPPQAEESLPSEMDWMMQNELGNVSPCTSESSVTVNEPVVDSAAEQNSCISDDTRRRLQEFQQMVLFRNMMSTATSASQVGGYPQSLAPPELEENVDSDRGYSSQQSIAEMSSLASVSPSEQELNDLKLLQITLHNESIGVNS